MDLLALTLILTGAGYVATWVYQRLLAEAIQKQAVLHRLPQAGEPHVVSDEPGTPANVEPMDVDCVELDPMSRHTNRVPVAAVAPTPASQVQTAASPPSAQTPPPNHAASPPSVHHSNSLAPEPKHSLMVEVQRDEEEKRREVWLDKFLFEGSEYRHVNLCINGVTGTGKTTLAKECIKRLGRGKKVEKWLCDPKHIAASPDWDIRPYCSGIEEVPDALNSFQKMMQRRMVDPSFNRQVSSHRFYILDEWDWIFAEYGKSTLSGCRKIIKVCRGVNDHAVICGQSALAKDTGFSGADFRQMGRIILEQEAIAFFENNQFNGSNKDELKQKASTFLERRVRFALIIPSKGLAEVVLVPDLGSSGSGVVHESVQAVHARTGEPLRTEPLNQRMADDSSGSVSSVHAVQNHEEPPIYEPVHPKSAKDRIRDLKEKGLNQTEIIEHIWNCKKGGSAKWKVAHAEYMMLMQGEDKEGQG